MNAKRRESGKKSKDQKAKSKTLPLRSAQGQAPRSQERAENAQPLKHKNLAANERKEKSMLPLISLMSAR
jgi:hypothetical protein